jgi:hypothetical protein
MEDLTYIDTGYIDTAVHERARPVRTGRASRATSRDTTREELAAGEPIDIYHWAAVALVTALMCAVLGYAAGTPALSRAANVTSLVFGTMGGALMAGGLIRRLRARLSGDDAGGAIERLSVAQSR